MMDQREDFANLVGRFRVRAGFTQGVLARKIGMSRNTVVNWENRSSRPESRELVLRLAYELTLTTDEQRALIRAAGFSVERWPTDVWRVPLPRDMFFTGRDQVLHALRQALVPGSTTALTQAISGLGGIGKTHTALEYAYRFADEYEAVLWLPADSSQTIASACVDVAGALGLPEQDEQDQTKIVEAVKRWLRTHRHWLLILDNIRDLQLLAQIVPTKHQGCVLITTQIPDAEPLAHTQILPLLPEREGILFLLRRTKRLSREDPLEHASREQYQEAREIWQEMEGLPLALDQAGAYILETGCSFAVYQEQFAHRRAELLARRGKRAVVWHETAVAATFLLLFDQVQSQSLLAADILSLCSFLHNEAIPEELFLTGAQPLGSFLAPSDEGLNEAVGVLRDHALVQRAADARTLSIHRLVQVILRDHFPPETQQQWMQRAISIVKAAYPGPDIVHWPLLERLLPHALMCATWIEERPVLATLDAASLLGQTGRYLADRARYAEAEQVWKRALQIEEVSLGTEHPDTARSLHRLAILYRRLARYAEAEHMITRALKIKEGALGAAHPSTVNSLGALADIYRLQGKYEVAEHYCQRALELGENQLGVAHLETMRALETLAGIYFEQEKYADAEPLCQRALETRTNQLGDEHPEVAISLNNLATLYQHQGRYTDAEPLYQRALEIWENQLGAEHPDTAIGLSNLAELYRLQGKYEAAAHYGQRALEIREHRVGKGHPQTAQTLHILAAVYREQGKYTQAEALYQRALRIGIQHLGADHRLTQQIRSDYALLLRAMNRETEAAELDKG